MMLVISLFTSASLIIPYASSIPSSTILLLCHGQEVSSKLLIHNVDLFILFIRIALFMKEEQSSYWLAQTIELIKNEWNCKLLSNHKSFISDLLRKYQIADSTSIKQTLFQIMERVLSFSISPSSLSFLLSYFTSMSTNTGDIINLLNTLYTLPCSSPEILLNKGSLIRFMGDYSNSIRLPNKDDWCFMISFRCLSEVDEPISLVSFKENKNELTLQLHGNTLQLFVNRLSVINTVTLDPTVLYVYSFLFIVETLFP